MTPPRSVLFLSPRSRLGGGAELSLLGMVREMSRLGARCTVSMPKDSESDLAPYICDAGGQPELISIPAIAPHRVPSVLGMLRRLRHLARAVDADVIHANSFGFVVLAGLASAAAGIPSVCHCRDPIRPGDLSGRLVRWAGRRLGRIITVSSAVAEPLMADALWRDKVTVVHNGIDVDAFAPDDPGPQSRADLGLPAGGKLIGIVGQVAPGKGHETVLAALPGILARVPDAHVVVVGDDRVVRERWGRSYMNEIQEKARSLNDHITWAGFHENVAAFMTQIDVLLVPSHWEPFGRVVIEGMACAKPVVAAATGGIPEIIDDGRTGVLVPSEDPAALGDATVRLLSDPARARHMGLAGRADVLERFTVARNARNVLAVHREVLDA